MTETHTRDSDTVKKFQEFHTRERTDDVEGVEGQYVWNKLRRTCCEFCVTIMSLHSNSRRTAQDTKNSTARHGEQRSKTQRTVLANICLNLIVL